MTIDHLLEKLRSLPQSIEFAEVMAVIEYHYNYQPTEFRNGDITNAAGQNAGSCKLLYFAQLQQLSVDQTLACFGQYYRHDVLQHPDGTDHQNIRNFMRSGWDGVKFAGVALSPK